jgi:gamma-glutamylcyclotransferase (GGCT)/AIG2-like uncharacterized protein YtfP
VLPDPPWPDASFPAEPYPGTRPPASFVQVDGLSRALAPDDAAPSGWRVDGLDLDAWLEARGAAPLAGRVPVLAYGSNANPSKITWMREHRDLTGPVVVLRASTTGLAAAWAAGLRVVDDQRPAVLVAAAGRTEQHAVWMAAPEQFASLDRVEGRVADPQRYRLARLRTGTVRTEDGGVVDGPYAYLGLDPIRHPLLVDGAPVFCDEVGQDQARTLTGDPAPDDGLDADTVEGVPHPDAWPSRVFVYGLLMPGQRSWSRLGPYATGEPRAAVLPGTVSDTGLGFPALTRDGVRGEVPGYVVELADPVAAMPGLDEYEGPEYRRVRVVLGDGTVCWTYLWTETSVPLTPLPHGWQ